MRDVMEYLPGMEELFSDIRERVFEQAADYDENAYTEAEVRRALREEHCTIEGLKALLSAAAEPYAEELAARAAAETARCFGNTVRLFTPLYLSNYCENRCLYCGFNSASEIRRLRLTPEEAEREMRIIAESGMEEILLLTGESRDKSSVEYIGEACRTARRYFRTVGLEIYPVNTEEYRYLHDCGADYVTVFQETYDPVRYGELHLSGHKRVWPYRFDAQERAILGGMRGVAFSALFGLGNPYKDALATALHAYYLQKKYPHAEISLSCPRICPSQNQGMTAYETVGEKLLCRILCAYRIFLPYAGITVSSRESARFRDGIVKIAATKVSAGVSTGVGDHAEKYHQADQSSQHGDEQFEIRDTRSLRELYRALSKNGLQPVLNESDSFFGGIVCGD